MKTMPLYLKYKDVKPIGVQALTNNFGVEILDIIPIGGGEEKAVVCFNAGGNRYCLHHVKINYHNRQDPRRLNIRYCGHRYYFDDFTEVH